MNIWHVISIVSILFALGHIIFSKFVIETPRWQKLLKLILTMILSILLFNEFGEISVYFLLGITMFLVLIVHGWWLPKKGINGWTAEPRDKYYELRGWKEKTEIS